MKAPIYIRTLSPEERAAIEAGLRSSDAFTLRRSQILLASSREQRPKAIAQNLGCATQTVRNALHAFEQKGAACLTQESSRPKTVQAEFDQAKCEALRAILHKPPHIYGKKTSLWTLQLAAEVCFEQGLTAGLVSIETIRQALLRLGVGWQRAKHWITSPDPDYLKKKNGVMPSLHWPSARDGLSAIRMRCGGVA
jgi:transposase